MYEATLDRERMRSDCLAVFCQETKTAVKWECGQVRCFTDDKDQPAIVLASGRIPEYDGYRFVAGLTPLAVQLSIGHEGEVE